MMGEKGLAYLWQTEESACVMTLDDWLEKDRLSIPVLGSDFSAKIMNKIQRQEKRLG